VAEQEKQAVIDNAHLPSLSQNLPEVDIPCLPEFEIADVAFMFGEKITDAGIRKVLSRHKAVFPAHFKMEHRGKSQYWKQKVRVLWPAEIEVLAGIMLPGDRLREVRLRVGNGSKVAMVPGRVVGRVEIREQIFSLAGITMEMRAADVKLAHQVLNDAAKATKKKYFQDKETGVVTSLEDPDHFARLEAAKTIYQAEGVDLKGGGDSKTAIQVNTNVQLPEHWMDEKKP
jgi:hypothetical protein